MTITLGSHDIACTWLEMTITLGSHGIACTWLEMTITLGSHDIAHDMARDDDKMTW